MTGAFFWHMEQIKVGIQGVKAAFHDMAARAYFDSQEILLAEFRDFRSMTQAVAKGEINYAMMAIENSLAGSLLPNYALLEEFGLSVVGEEYLRIEMQLMALPGQTLDQINQVVSHPIALRQCDVFLENHPNWRVTEWEDTAGSAKSISERNLEGVAAIAGKLAATTYGLEILAPSIETNKKNYTRFLVVSNQANVCMGCNKSSLRLILSHIPGALAHALVAIEGEGINLSKIQSVPIVGKPYEYAIHLDLEFARPEQLENAVVELKKMCIEVKTIGVYKQGNKPVKV